MHQHFLTCDFKICYLSLTFKTVCNKEILGVLIIIDQPTIHFISQTHLKAEDYVNLHIRLAFAFQHFCANILFNPQIKTAQGFWGGIRGKASTPSGLYQKRFKQGQSTRNPDKDTDAETQSETKTETQADTFAKRRGIQTYCTSQLQGFSELFRTFYLARILVLALQGRGHQHSTALVTS